jgi:hypothetical protein
MNRIKTSYETTRARNSDTGLSYASVHDDKESSSKPRVDIREFPRIAEKLIDRIDVRQSGFVSASDLDRAVQDPSIKGRDAQVLAALYNGVKRGNLPRQGISRSYLDDLSEQMAHPPANKYKAENLEILEEAIIADMDKVYGLNRVSKNLYSDSAHPERSIKLDAINQGVAGTCALLSVLGSLAENRPADVVKMLRTNPDGSYDVNLPGVERPLHVGPITEVEQSMFDSSNYGVWPNVFEKAFGRFRQEKDGAPRSEDPILAAGNGTDAYYKNENETMFLLTGRQPRQIRIADASETDLLAQIKLAAQGHRLMATGIGSSDNFGQPIDYFKEGLHNNHAYTVLGTRGNSVIVRDPHGYSDRKGNPVKTLPIAEFKREFRWLSIERAPEQGR